MAITHRILDDLYEESFALLAIHSGMQGHSLAYTLNQSLKIQLKRAKEDLDFAEDIFFPYFEWKDEFNDVSWKLIANHSSKEVSIGSEGLFGSETAYKVHHLVPEHKDVDYFLKVEPEMSEVNETALKAILSIPKVVTAYHVDAETTKSKQNLIF